MFSSPIFTVTSILTFLSLVAVLGEIVQPLALALAIGLGLVVGVWMCVLVWVWLRRVVRR